MAKTATREALVEQGALLFARRGVAAVSARELHAAVGSRNESALHYHFGGRDGLVDEILRRHLQAIEDRRAHLVAGLAADERTGEVRGLVHALAAPMAADLGDPVGRAHLRIVAQLSHPSLGYQPPFRVTEAPAGTAVVRWLGAALSGLPAPLRVERLAALRAQLIGLFAQRAQLIDDDPAGAARAPDDGLFVENLLDMLVAGLTAPPSPAALARCSSPASANG